MIRIVLMWPTPFGSKLLSYILENLRIEYCLFIGVPGFEDDRLDYIPWHHAYGAEYEHYISWENLPPLDEEIISQMASCESSTFRLMDYEFEFQSDSAYGCHRSRYLKHLRYWNWLLDEKRINLVVDYEIPHMFYDSIAYHLCQLKGIPFLMLSYTPVPGMFTWIEDWEKSAILIHKNFVKLCEEKTAKDSVHLSEPLQKHYEYMLSENPIPVYMTTRWYESWNKESFQHYMNEIETLKKIESIKKWVQLKITFYEFLIDALSPRWKSSLSLKKFEGFNLLKYILYKFREPFFWQRLLTLDVWIIRRWKNRMILSLQKRCENLVSRYRGLIGSIAQNFYNQHCIEPDFSQKYIYVALHYQPELSTMPLAGAYVNQALMVSLLSHSVPGDVLIYVKEHPMQGWQCRSINFYRDILAMRNVRLIRRDSNTFELSRHALAVATCTGNVGWEALFMGKPVLMFGHYVYQYAPGVIQIKTLDDCRRAMHKIINENFKPNLQDLKLFLKAMEKTCFFANIDQYTAELIDISPDESVEQLTQSLLDYLSSLPKYSHKQTN